MLLEYLEYIETIMKHLISGENLDFSKTTEESFFSIKNNLFNLITIKKLIRNYQENHDLDLEQFFQTGRIPSLYEKAIEHPNLPNYYKGKEEILLENIIRALKENNFAFTKENGIIISTQSFEMILPEEWLYRLSEYFSTMKYKEVFLFNKNIENNIFDEYSLVNYLHHTKTFFVEMFKKGRQKEYEETFLKSANITSSIHRKSKKVNVDTIASTFKDNVPLYYNLEITKFKIPSPLFILRKVHEFGPEFYKKDLRQSKKLIQKWLVEYLDGQNLDDEFTQKYLLSLKQNQNISLSRKNREKCIRSLFSLYILLLNEYNLNYNNISLSDFKIKSYESSIQQENLAQLRETIKKINEIDQKGEYKKMVTRISETMQEIKKLNGNEDYELLQLKKKELDNLIITYEQYEKERTKYLQERNSLQNAIQAEQFNDLTELAFDNGRIMSLIHQAAQKGRIYINPLDTKKLLITTFDKTTGSQTFICEIALKKLLNFIENTNNKICDLKLSISA